MTRVNVVSPTELCDQHLVAEYRELPRVFALASAAARRQREGGRALMMPDRYVLGSGHVKFFYNKLLWVSNRHIMLVGEMARRGFAHNIVNPERKWSPDRNLALLLWWQWWDPDFKDLALNRQRIKDRMPALARWTNSRPPVN